MAGAPPPPRRLHRGQVRWERLAFPRLACLDRWNHTHAVTTPLEPRRDPRASPPLCSEGRRCGQSHRSPWRTPRPAQHARWSTVSPTRTTEMAYAAAPAPSRTPVELEPPIAVANTLGKLWPPLDPTDTVAVTPGSFFPLQSDTSTATGAHRALATDGSTAAEENRGNTPSPTTRA